MATGDGHSEEAPKIKSQKSVVYSFIRFQNTTSRRVDIIWINYEGCRVKYQSIDRGEFLDINTFVGHPWIFCDSETGERMVAQLREVFQPTAWNTEWKQWPPKRKVVNITIPVYTLQDCCLHTVRKYVPPDKIDTLEVTEILKDEIYKTFRMTRPPKEKRKKRDHDSVD